VVATKVNDRPDAARRVQYNSVKPLGVEQEIDHPLRLNKEVAVAGW
jgi:hypothetical protein